MHATDAVSEAPQSPEAGDGSDDDGDESPKGDGTLTNTPKKDNVKFSNSRYSSVCKIIILFYDLVWLGTDGLSSKISIKEFKRNSTC
jgi:hypothetical protein